MRGRKEKNYDNKVPGPGTYRKDDINLKDSAPSWRFGSSGRNNVFNTNANKGPSPGDYNQMNKTSGGFKFGSDSRFKAIKKEIPGPGNYKIPTSIVDVPNRYMATGGKFMEEFKFV